MNGWKLVWRRSVTAGTVFRGGLLGLLLCAGMLATGCARRGDAPFGLNGDAEVRLSLGVDHSENEQVVSRTAMPRIDPHKDLAVYVINTHEDTLARWASFDDVPSVLRFTPGAYKVVAEYRPAGARVPDFDTYIYRAEEKFVIKAKDDLHINLVARLATVKISVEFDSNFDFFYQSYSVDIRTVGKDSLRFVDGETRCGFFEPGSVRMRFNLVTREGRRLVFSPAPLAKAQAADAYTLKLRVASDQGNVSGIIITTDDAMNPDKEVWVEVPKYFLPKDKPTIAPTGFVSGVSQSVFEGSVAKWSVAAEAQGGVSSFVIRLEDGPAGVLGTKLGAALEGKSEIDLASLPEEAPLRRALREAGFVWSAGLNSPEDAAIATSVWVDFSGAMRAREDGSAAVYDFSFAVTDNYDQQPDVDHPCAVKAEVRVPTVRLMEPKTENAWATKVDLTVSANYDVAAGTHPVLQFRRTTASAWNDAEEGTDVRVVAVADVAGGVGYAARYELCGLQPGTDYVFRIVANERPGTEEYGLTTETEEKLPNRDFSGYREEPALFGKKLLFDDWATRNPATAGQMSQDNVPADATTCQNLTYREADMNGADWICMKTAYWGRSETRKQSWGTWGAWTTTTPKNITAGILYLGSYTYALKEGTDQTGIWLNYTGYAWEYLDTEDITSGRGIAFGSRPAALKLKYIFLPKKDDTNRDNGYIVVKVYGTNGALIGNGEWKSGTTDAAEKTAATDLTVPIEYTVTDVRAAKIDVFFSSSDRYGKDDGPACHGGIYIGNILKIKDVSLDYEFKCNE